MRCTQIPLVVVALSNQSHHSNRSNEELLKRDVRALCQSVSFWMSTGRHVHARSEASPKCLLEGTDEFWAAITDQHSG
jgi:hypothetical protein